MQKAAYIFPGQGAQFIGMGRELYDGSPAARAVFEQADAVMGRKLTGIIFNGPAETLTSTEFCQPAILTVSVAAVKALESSAKAQAIRPCFVAGLSLGELSALAVSGALSFEETLKLVRRRAEFMEEAAKLSAGKMAAVIGLDKETIAAVCRETGAEVANFNSPQQTVITGHADKVEAACARLKEAGAKNVVVLDVAGGFHSSLMKPAADKFKVELSHFQFKPAAVPLVSNVDAFPATDPARIRDNLAAQITSSVLWVDTVEYIASQGVTLFFELGPGKVLKGLIRKINPALQVHNIQNPTDIESLPV